MIKRAIFAAAAVAAACAYGAPKGDKVYIWPEGAMPSVNEAQKVKPYVEFFKPEKPTTGACIMIAPGGAYMGWAEAIEGFPARDYFLSKGMHVAMFRYRTPRPKGLPKHLTAWQDAQRAVRVVRSQAAARGIDPYKIGMMGFSAGGHLTMMAAVSSMTRAYEPVDGLDKIDCRVNWAVPVYPAYLLSDGESGGNSERGNDLVKHTFVPELAFDAATPPMCFMHGDSDVYSSMGSVRAYHKLRTMGIPAEMHVMADMGHVFFRNCREGEPASKWLDRVWDWMYVSGINTIHPRTSPKDGWKLLMTEYGKMAELADFKPGIWKRDLQNVLSASEDSAIWFKGEYSNFILDFEYKLDSGANSGVLLHCCDTEKWIPNSVEIQLLDDHDKRWAGEPPQNRNGAIYGHLAPLVSNVKQAGEWNRMTIWATGRKLKAAVNNEIVFDCDLSRWTSAETNPDGTKIPKWLSRPLADLEPKGRIGFQGRHGSASPHFRQIWIKAL